MNLVDDIPPTTDDFEHVNCIIEIPKGTNTKYEYDENLNIFKLDRCLVSSLQYPINYGFIPRTIALDGDPLDVLVFNHDPIDRGVLVSCRVLGVLGFIDGGKVVAEGDHANLLNKSDIYKNFYQKQLAKNTRTDLI